jgi:flagellar hook assembly protein FlgD
MRSKALSVAFLFSVTSVAIKAFAAPPAPGVELRADPVYFSPNGNGLQDEVFFHPVLSGGSAVQRWRLDVMNAKGKRIDRTSGAGLPALLKWDGLDKKGAAVPEGEYRVRLDVYGRGYHVFSQEKIVVDVQSPVVGLSLSTSTFTKSLVSTESLTMRPNIFDNSPTARWSVQILNEADTAVQVFASTGPLHDVQWDGSDATSGIWAPPGNYHCVMTAWDMAGHESKPFSVDLKVNVSTRQMLERSLKYIRVNETDSGLLVQLQAADLFRLRKGHIVWAPSAATMLNEVSILANAYPSASINLDGYVKTKKPASADRKLSSVYSWRVYSFLVKEGHVTASRFTSVRGRGRSAMFGRRAIPVPVLSNGVEITLEGNSW